MASNRREDHEVSVLALYDIVKMAPDDTPACSTPNRAILCVLINTKSDRTLKLYCN